MTSNAHVLVAREMISGRIAGVDFGPELHCLARSPESMLVWDSGHSYTSGQQTRYAGSGLILILNRPNPIWGTSGGRRDYMIIGREGGRLGWRRIREEQHRIEPVFGPAYEAIVEAVRLRMTLIIEGGGRVPMPSRRSTLDYETFVRWRDTNIAEERNGMTGV